MKQIRVVIERAKDDYGPYGETVDGIWGAGDTVQEAKASAQKSLELFLKNNKAKYIPAALKGEYELVYKFDRKVFLITTKAYSQTPPWSELPVLIRNNCSTMPPA